jgi:hypothetical protein
MPTAGALCCDAVPSLCLRFHVYSAPGASLFAPPRLFCTPWPRVTSHAGHRFPVTLCPLRPLCRLFRPPPAAPLRLLLRRAGGHLHLLRYLRQALKRSTRGLLGQGGPRERPVRGLARRHDCGRQEPLARHSLSQHDEGGASLPCIALRSGVRAACALCSVSVCWRKCALMRCV